MAETYVVHRGWTTLKRFGMSRIIECALYQPPLQEGDGGYWNMVDTIEATGEKGRYRLSGPRFWRIIEESEQIFVEWKRSAKRYKNLVPVEELMDVVNFPPPPPTTPSSPSAEDEARYEQAVRHFRKEVEAIVLDRAKIAFAFGAVYMGILKIIDLKQKAAVQEEGATLALLNLIDDIAEKVVPVAEEMMWSTETEGGVVRDQTSKPDTEE